MYVCVRMYSSMLVCVHVYILLDVVSGLTSWAFKNMMWAEWVPRCELSTYQSTGNDLASAPLMPLVHSFLSCTFFYIQNGCKNIY